MDRIERVILNQLFYNDEYVREVVPFLKPEYFIEDSERKIYEHINQFFLKYNTRPSPEAIFISIDSDKKITGALHESVSSCLAEVSEKALEEPIKWLVDTTEEWCKKRAFYNALTCSIQLYDKGGSNLDSAVELMKDALSVAFQSEVGLDFDADAEKRYEEYCRQDSGERFPFHIDLLNVITKNGVKRKTLNCVMAPTGVGKSIFLADLAVHYRSIGKNVLYISLEMDEYDIAQRMDASMMNLQMQDIPMLTRERYLDKIKNSYPNPVGKIFIKQFPTACANVNHFRHLLNELKMKKKFIPDAIMIDYINIAASSRAPSGSNSYTTIKSIAEEFRGLAVEQDVVVWSATQPNKEGMGDMNMNITQTSESIGLPQTLDFFVAMMSNEELDERKQIMFKQLKNRYGPLDVYRKFIVGLDRSRMKFFNADSSSNATNQPPEEPLIQFPKLNTGKKPINTSGIKF